MATSHDVNCFSGEAGTACTIYRLVVRAADGQYDHSGAGADADGVCAESQATVGAVMPIAAMRDGSILKIEAGAAVANNAQVESDASGRAVTHVSGAGKYRLGKALAAAGAAGEIIPVLVHKELDEVT